MWDFLPKVTVDCMAGMSTLAQCGVGRLWKLPKPATDTVSVIFHCLSDSEFSGLKKKNNNHYTFYFSPWELAGPVWLLVFSMRCWQQAVAGAQMSLRVGVHPQSWWWWWWCCGWGLSRGCTCTTPSASSLPEPFSRGLVTPGEAWSGGCLALRDPG